MLSDLIASLITPLSPHLRALGYLDETLDMRRRSRLNREAWQQHLDHTRKFVLASSEKCSNRDRVVILGSGLLLDVPLADLSEMFKTVILRDVVCLPETRKQIRSCQNVVFVEDDVTGLAERLHRNRRQGIIQLPEVAPPAVECDGTSLVVSLNILSQLWVVPRAFIGRQLRQFDPGQVDDWCAGIVERHYTWLRSLPCEVCLVADHEAIKRDRSGSIVSRASSVYGLTLPRPDESWAWDIAPLGRENPHTSKELIVGAWNFRPAETEPLGTES